jgi:serine/threonine protein kinase
MDDGHVVNYINFVTKKQKRIFILGHIGQGKFGTVYKGMLEGYGFVAVKHQIISDSLLHALATEIKISQKVSSKVAFILRKNLLSVHTDKLGEDEFVSVSQDVPENSALSLYDLADGVNLSNLIMLNKSVVSAPIMDRYLQELLVCLHALENAGIAHRDIKPDNFMLDKGRIKLIDFGFACFYRTCRGQNGTANFLPPEFFIQPQLVLWHKADVFALGVTMLSLLCNNVRLYESLPFQNLEKAKFFFRNTSSKKLNEIFQTKIVALIPDFPLLERYTELLFHMVDANPEMRWTVSQCSDWLKLTKIRIEDDLQLEFLHYEKQTEAQQARERAEEERQKKLEEEMGMFYS